MKNKKGYTLTEILIVLSILGIITGIATVSYRGYILSVNKSNLKQAGIMFATAVNTCIQSMGAWSPRPDVTPPLLPCKADNTTELKSKLDFTCPPDATCNPLMNPDKDSNGKYKYKWYCLSISKEVSGKKLQVLTRIPYDNPSDYQIWCGQVSAYLFLGGKTCKKSAGYRPAIGQSRVTLQSKGFEKGCANFK